MLNSLDVAVMVIEQPPAPVPAVVSLVNRSFCELFGLDRAQVEQGSYLQFMDLVRPILPDWDAQLVIIEDLLADPTAERIDEITLLSNRAGRHADAPASLRHARARRPRATSSGGCSFSATSPTTRRSSASSSIRKRWTASARWRAAWRTTLTTC